MNPTAYTILAILALATGSLLTLIFLSVLKHLRERKEKRQVVKHKAWEAHCVLFRENVKKVSKVLQAEEEALMSKSPKFALNEQVQLDPSLASWDHPDHGKYPWGWEAIDTHYFKQVEIGTVTEIFRDTQYLQEVVEERFARTYDKEAVDYDSVLSAARHYVKSARAGQSVACLAYWEYRLKFLNDIPIRYCIPEQFLEAYANRHMAAHI